MNKTDREKRNAEIVLMRKNGASMADVAKRYGLSEGGVYAICKQNGVAGVMSNKKVITLRNQYTSGKFDRESNARRYIDERTPGFEYAGNFTGVDGFVDLKCRTCGTVITRSFVTVRHGKVACPKCKQREREDAKAERKKQKQEELERRQFEKKRQKKLNRKAVQIQMRSCLSCGSLFAATKSSTKYCSDKCRNQNKWRMKDGYRNLFPLEEVYKRDNGICYLCGKPCDWNDYEEHDGVIVYGNNYPSRDHVIPKSKGGVNDWDNIRLAHRICNSLKSDSPLIKKTG